jgi:hypothetical protein
VDAVSSDKEDTGFTIQVAAGALAAVTAAVLGSTLGIAGTVLGAGIASVVSTVGASLYLRSIRGVHARVAKTPRARRPVVVVLAASALAFVVGMLVITGVEWVRGAQLSGGGGTTIGSLVRPSQGPAERPAENRVTIQPGETTESSTVTTSQTPAATTDQTTPSQPVTSTEPPSTPPPSTTTTGSTTSQPPPASRAG